MPTPRMKLAIISAKFPFGREEPFLEAEISALAEYIEELTLIPTAPARRLRYPEVPANVLRVPLWSIQTLAAAFRVWRSDRTAAVRALRSIVVERGSLATKLKNIAVFPKALAVAEIVKQEGIDHIHSYWLSAPSTVAYIAAQISRKPWSSTAHHWDIHESNLPQTKAGSAAFIRTTSRRGLTDLRKQISPEHWERTIMLHLGINVPPQRAAYPLAARHRPLTLLCAASLLPTKGHAVLIEALARVRDCGVVVRCFLTGGGPLRAPLAALIRRRRLSSVITMVSTVPRNALLRQLQSGEYDAMVFPTIDRGRGKVKGIPATLIEGMAVGLPCIATDAGHIPELLDNSCGIPVGQNDSGALAEAILKLARDPQRGAELGTRAQERVVEHYNARHTAAVLSAVMRRSAMLEERPSGLVAEALG